MSKNRKIKYINSVNLSGLDYLFNPNQKLKLSKCNLIFGRNASGKSSITRYIKHNGSKVLSNNINNNQIHVFNRQYILKHMISNTIRNKSGNRLTSIALGKTNVDIHNKLQNLHLVNYTLQNSVQEITNELNKIKDKYSNKRAIKDSWLINSARSLKNNYRDIVKSTYNKKDFAKDLHLSKYSQNISKDKLTILKNRLSKDVQTINPLHNIFPDIDITKLYVEVKLVLKSTVGPNFLKSLKGIDNNSKVTFAERGMKLHKHCDICAFCGNKITQRRRDELNKFFNKKYFTIRNKINYLCHIITNYRDELDDIYQLNINKFNVKYQPSANNLNDKIQKLYKYNRNLLKNMLYYLHSKSNNINHTINLSTKNLDISFPFLQDKINSLININNNYQRNINNNINKKMLREKIRLYYVNNKKNKFISKHPRYSHDIYILKQRMNDLQTELNIKSKHIQKISTHEKLLLSHSQKKDIAQKSINKCLKSLRDNSFKLKYSNESNGEYYIYSKNSRKNKERGFDTLSSGERNLISFLYFYNAISPNNPEINASKTQLIIFDDPMDGNDEEFQYLLVELLQRLINRITLKNNKQNLLYPEYKNYQLIIFTHNVNFYLNIKHDINKNRLNNIHLIKLENKTGIQYITSHTPDFYNNYEELWAETRYLYNQHQYNIMLNPIRRIIETFLNFNFIPKNKFYKGHENIKKLLDINSHGINDINTIPNVHNGNFIINNVRTLFYNVEGKRHFNKYWNQFKNYGKSSIN